MELALSFPWEASTSTAPMYAMKADEPIKRSGIAARPTDERPRERLLARGPEALQKQNDKKNKYALAHFAELNEHRAGEGYSVDCTSSTLFRRPVSTHSSMRCAMGSWQDSGRR